MAGEYLITIVLDEEKVKRLEEAGLGSDIEEVNGNKVIKVALPEKNQRKFSKAFKETSFNDQTGEVDNFPEDAADMLFEVIIENKTTEVMHLFLMKAFNPLAGRELRHKVH
jgi:hypothetical protein